MELGQLCSEWARKLPQSMEEQPVYTNAKQKANVKACGYQSGPSQCSEEAEASNGREKRNDKAKGSARGANERQHYSFEFGMADRHRDVKQNTQ